MLEDADRWQILRDSGGKFCPLRKEKMLCFLYKNFCSLLSSVHTQTRKEEVCRDSSCGVCAFVRVCVKGSSRLAFKEFHTHTHIRSGRTKSTLPDDDEISMKPNTTGDCAEHLASLCKVWIILEEQAWLLIVLALNILNSLLCWLFQHPSF